MFNLLRPRPPLLSIPCIGAALLRWGLVCWLIGALWPPTCLAAHSRIVEQAFVRDRSGQMTLAEAQRQPQTPYRGHYLQVIDPSVVWIRLRIAPDPAAATASASATASGAGSPATTAPAEPVTDWLRVIPMWTQSLALHDPLQRGGAGRSAGLDATPVAAPFKVQTLPMPLAAGARDVWLRFEAAGTAYLAVSLLSAEEAELRAVSDSALQGLVIGVQALLIMVGVLAWMMDSSGIGASMVLKQVVNLLMALLNADFFLRSGMASGLPLPGGGSSAHAVELLRLLNLALSLWFFGRVLQRLEAPRWSLLALRVPLALMALGPLLLWLGELALLRLLLLALYAGLPILLVLTSLVCRREPLNPATPLGLLRRGVEKLAFALLLLIAWATSFPTGFYKTQDLSFFGVMLPLCASSAVGVMLVVVWQRLRTDQRRQDDRQRQAALDALALASERGERQRQQEFMVMLTHELKAPLSTLGLVLGAPVASATMRGHADLALSSMRRVIDHCAQSVEFEDATSAPHPVACSLWTEIALRRDAQADRDRIRLVPSPDLPPALVDPRMLAVILNNLLENALRYSPRASPVTVSLTRETHPQGALQHICVSNQPATGPLPDAGRLFQKYYRGEAAQRSSGSGLGLYLSRLLARRLGGDLSYGSAGQIVSFTLVLPE